MRYFSMFAGCGGFDLALDEAGHECVGYSEIDKYAIQIYKKNFGEGRKNYGDARHIKTEDVPDFDLLVGGFPCQDFSVAGHRRGLEGTRGTLFYEIARVVESKRPRYILLENVKGLINHKKGDTFRKIVDTLRQLGYRVDYGVLNSRYFGVPQNRERVFIVGSLREEPRPEVFPLRESDVSDKRQIASTTVGANYWKGIDNHGQRTAIAYMNDVKDISKVPQGVVASPVVQVDEATKKGYAEATIGDSINLSCMSSKMRRGRVGKGVTNTLDTGMQQHVIDPGSVAVVGYSRKSDGSKTHHFKDTFGTVKSSASGRTSNQSEYIATGVNRPSRGHESRKDAQACCLKAGQSGSKNLCHDVVRIRRLTPLECERLQGFPDKWTEGVSDTQRYKMMGNAVTVNVIRAIVARLPK